MSNFFLQLLQYLKILNKNQIYFKNVFNVHIFAMSIFTVKALKVEHYAPERSTRLNVVTSHMNSKWKRSENSFCKIRLIRHSSMLSVVVYFWSTSRGFYIFKSANNTEVRIFCERIQTLEIVGKATVVMHKKLFVKCQDCFDLF